MKVSRYENEASRIRETNRHLDSIFWDTPEDIAMKEAQMQEQFMIHD
jgi:hypothetical protein